MSLFPKISGIDSIPLRSDMPLQPPQEFMARSIEEMAIYISDIYATFLELTNEERLRLKEKGMELYPLQEDLQEELLSDLSKIERFRTALKERIIEDLSQLKNGRSVVYLSIDSCPEKKLREVCQSIFTHNLCFAFPCKSSIRVLVRNEQFSLTMRFERSRSGRILE
jgi:hypothetical protein